MIWSGSHGLVSRHMVMNPTLDIDPVTITARWKNTINMRLTSDKIIATKIKCKNKFTNLVVNMWKPLLTKDRPLPHNWITNCEVLVGRRP